MKRISATRGDDFEATRISGEPLTAEPPPDPDLAIKPQNPSTLAVITNNGDREVGPLKGDGLLGGVDPKSIFRAKGEAVLAIGNDGDDEIGRTACDQAVSDMLDSGHGFLVRKGKEPPKTVRAEVCEICGGPLPPPGNDPDWLCQYGDETQPASLDCNCPWCLSYQDYMRGTYKPNGGRPRKRCGTKKCDTEANRRRQANKRARDKGNKLPWPDMDDGPHGPFTVDQVAAALEKHYEEHYELARRRRAEKLDSMTRRDPWQGQRRSRGPAGANRWSGPCSPSSP